MFMMRFYEVLIVVLVAILSVCQAQNFECYPNATMRVQNPGAYTTVFANNSVNICSSEWSAGNTHVYITNCGMDDDILVAFSNFTSTFHKVIGGIYTGNTTFTINCLQIAQTGDVHTVDSSLEMSVGQNKSEYHEVLVTSNLYNNFTEKTVATVASVGSPLFWVMEAWEENFDLRPDECWVYGGKAIIENVPRKFVILNGCSLDSDLAMDFQWYQPTNGTVVWGVMYSFRFYGSEYVTMQCRVRVCPRPSDACKIDCPDQKRRRRASPNGDQSVENRPGSKSERDEYHVLTKHVRIVECNQVDCLISESTSDEMECIWLVLVWISLRIF